MKKLSICLTAVAAAALFAMMWLTFADVFARKFLPNAVRGAVELTELLMLVMIFCALPLVALAHEHIVFDLFDRLLPARLLRWQKVLSQALTALVFGGAAWLVWQRAVRTAAVGDMTSALEIRLAPYHFMAAGMLALSALVHAALAWRAHREAPSPFPASPQPLGQEPPP
ncbi:MAG: TRAP transporter small permease [Rubrivivax sp.]|nr:TRAP transporter small permease [Rubrivivax sp.]